MSYRKPLAELNANTPIVRQQLTREAAARAREIARVQEQIRQFQIQRARQASNLEYILDTVPRPRALMGDRELFIGENVTLRNEVLANPGILRPTARRPPPMKTGGLIKSTGVYTLHKGEVVVPAARVKSVDMSLKKDKKVPLKK